MNIIEQNINKINGRIDTFDRLIINGYILGLCNFRQFLFYLIQNNIMLKDFKNFALEQTSILCDHIENYINDCHVQLHYLSSGKIDKNLEARKYFLDPSHTGLIAAFSVVENCNTMTVIPNKKSKKLEIAYRPSKCKYYYFYYNDQEFGWMYLKIQTWFPYNVQIYINGREYLSKLMDKNNIKYERYNNSFSYVENYEKAQSLADGILSTKISSSLDGLIKKINCHLPNIYDIFSHKYDWCIDQCEFATDINFKSREELKSFYKTLVERTYFAFSSEDIYSFFGRNISRIHTFTKGDIVSDLRRRYQGYRIKFKINSNQIKMYDKGNNLRIEVTINNPRDFKIIKEETKDGEVTKKWKPMGKSIANMYRYAQISQSIIKRYIEALPTVEDDKATLESVKEISEAKESKGRRYSGFNILSKGTLSLFQTIASGEYLINGFTNKMIRQKIFKESENPYSISKMTRILAKLKAHGIVKKVYRKNKYYLTNKGKKVTTSILLYTGKDLINAYE